MKGVNFEELSSEEIEWVQRLESSNYGQKAVIDQAQSVEDTQSLVNQMKEFEESLPGGVLVYIQRARELLSKIQNNVNDLDSYIATVPEREQLQPGREAFETAEIVGLSQLHTTAFVLVAGGLGERLGLSEPKILLPMELVTGMSFLEFYIQLIKAWEFYAYKQTAKSAEIPLVIMTSKDTHHKTKEFLRRNCYFGLHPKQIHLLKQGTVPAFINNQVQFSVLRQQGILKIEEKPHGHGDIHRLLHNSGLPDEWIQQGKKWLILFQDTNILMFHALPALLGRSFIHHFTMNSLATPRRPGEAVGALCCLIPRDESQTTTRRLIMNIEYNHLEAFLKASGLQSDAPDPVTGYSRFPGNTNVLVFDLVRYAVVLHKSKGIVPEFINPKYTDERKTEFKCSSRLECMMQSFPYLLDVCDRVGITEIERWFCFSTVKNNVEDAASRCRKNLPPESAFSAECDYYAANCKCLQLAAHANGYMADVASPISTCFGHVWYPLGPKVVILPSFAFSLLQLKERIRGTLKLHPNATLVLDGNLQLENVDVDGTLQLRNGYRDSLIYIRDLKIHNKGFHLIPFDCSEVITTPFFIKIRGYFIEKLESTDIVT